MKLYNLLEEIIFEEKRLLTENVSDEEVLDAIENKYNVNITYDDYPDTNTPPSKRYIQVYNLNTTKAGNKAIRAFQLAGPSKTTVEGAWKLFRVDRIRSWQPTKMKFYRPVSDLDTRIPDYNMSGQEKPRSPVASVQKAVNFEKLPAYTPKPSGEPMTPEEKAAYLEKMKTKKIISKPSNYAGYVEKPVPIEKSPLEKPEDKKPVDTSATTGPKPSNKILKPKK